MPAKFELLRRANLADLEHEAVKAKVAGRGCRLDVLRWCEIYLEMYPVSAVKKMPKEHDELARMVSDFVGGTDWWPGKWPEKNVVTIFHDGSARWSVNVDISLVAKL